MADGSGTNVQLQDRRDAEILLKRRLDRAERIYDRALTTLWIGNAAGALATLAYITANRHDGTFTRSLLIPLVLFVLGLATIGVSSLLEFESERRAIARIAGRIAGHESAPVGASGAYLRTASALVSGACFTVAFVFCFAMLARN